MTTPEEQVAAWSESISAICKDAFYGARDHGGTMHTAADDAAAALLASPVLAEIRAAAAAEVLREAATSLGSGPEMRVLIERESSDWWATRPVDGWLRERADRVAPR